MNKQSIRYQVTGKATVEMAGDHIQHALKLLYRGDGTPWWTCNAGLELAVSPELFNAAKVGSFVTITVESDAQAQA